MTILSLDLMQVKKITWVLKCTCMRTFRLAPAAFRYGVLFIVLQMLLFVSSLYGARRFARSGNNGPSSSAEQCQTCDRVTCTPSSRRSRCSARRPRVPPGATAVTFVFRRHPSLESARPIPSLEGRAVLLVESEECVFWRAERWIRGRSAAGSSILRLRATYANGKTMIDRTLRVKNN